VRLQGPARRVVTLAPNLTEYVHALGAGAALVGTDAASNHPAEVRALPRVGDHARLDVERLLSLRPDLVVAWHRGTPGRDLQQVAAAGVPIAAFDPRTLDDPPRVAARLAVLLGAGPGAASFEARWLARLDALRTTYAARSPVSVFYQAWPQPLLTLGAGHVVHQAIAACGGRPALADLPGLAPAVSLEAVVAARPQLIVAAAEGGLGEPRRAPDRPEFAMWAGLGSVPAVRHGQLFVLDGDLISRAGPRLLEGVAQLCAVMDRVRQEAPR
jgi:iron complex transport system substrate-binding protein